MYNITPTTRLFSSRIITLAVAASILSCAATVAQAVTNSLETTMEIKLVPNSGAK